MCMWLYFWSQWAAVAWLLDADFVERRWRYTTTLNQKTVEVWEWNYSFIIQDAGYQKLKPMQSTQDFQTTEKFNCHRRGNPHWFFHKWVSEILVVMNIYILPFENYLCTCISEVIPIFFAHVRPKNITHIINSMSWLHFY